jgi:hypothetical protein
MVDPTSTPLACVLLDSFHWFVSPAECLDGACQGQSHCVGNFILVLDCVALFSALFAANYLLKKCYIDLDASMNLRIAK